MFNKTEFDIPVGIEARYVDHLNLIGQQVKQLCIAHANNPAELSIRLRAYGELIEEWARSVALNMITETSNNRSIIFANQRQLNAPNKTRRSKRPK